MSRTTYTNNRYSQRTTAGKKGRASAFAKARGITVNQPVKRVYNPPKRIPRTMTGKNAKAVTILAKQVNALQRSKMGQYQKTVQTAQIGFDDGDLVAHRPYAFLVNDFMTNSAFYRGQAVTGLDGIQQPSFNVVTHNGKWVKQDFTYGTTPTPGIGDHSIPDTNNYWFGAQDDTPDPAGYTPISCDFVLNFEAPSMYANKDWWIRIDIFTQKQRLTHSNAHLLALPNNLGALGYMASDDLIHRNRFNKEYFNILKTKWVNIRNKSQTEQMTVNRYVKFRWKFSKSQIRSCEKLAIYGEDDKAVTIHDANNGISAPSFLSQMPIKDQVWCMISTNVPSGKNVKCELQRFISWRDRNGVAT